jgi:hypothetical protein
VGFIGGKFAKPAAKFANFWSSACGEQISRNVTFPYIRIQCELRGVHGQSFYRSNFFFPEFVCRSVAREEVVVQQ